MSLAQTREIAAAQRLENVRYAIRDLALVADEVTRQGHTVLSLNVGDPNIFDFQTPAHLIEAVYRAMKDNKNGYAPSSGIKEALDAIRAEAARDGGYLPDCPNQSWRKHTDAQSRLPALFRGALEAWHPNHYLRPQ